MDERGTSNSSYEAVTRRISDELPEVICADGFPIYQDDPLREAHALVEAYLRAPEGDDAELDALAELGEAALEAAGVHYAWVSEQVFGARDGKIVALARLLEALLSRHDDLSRACCASLLRSLSAAAHARRDAAPWGPVVRATEDALARDGLTVELSEALGVALGSKGWDEAAPDHRALLARIARAREGLHRPFVQLGEPWADTLWAELDAMEPDARAAWEALLSRLPNDRPRPSTRWLTRREDLVEAVGEDALRQAIVRWLPLIGERSALELSGVALPAAERTLVSPRNEELARGLVWMCVPLMDDVLAGVLGDLALTCYRKLARVGPRAPKLGNACIRALGEVDEVATAGQLWRLQLQLEYKAARTQVERALGRMADRMDLDARELEELSVPECGLDRFGASVARFDLWDARIEVGEKLKVGVTWSRAATPQLTLLDTPAPTREQKSAPKAVRVSHPEELARLEVRVKELEALLHAQRDRLEALMSSPRRWSLEKWRARYLDHPLVGLLARRLVWQFERADGTSRSGMWDEGRGAVVDAEGVAIDGLDAWSTARLWHPARASRQDVRAWRASLARTGQIQPFRQAYREVYELSTGSEANSEALRVDARLVRQHQFAALCKSRRWTYTLQGSWGSDPRAVREDAEWGVEVWFTLEPVESPALMTGAGVYTYALTGALDASGASLSELDPALRSELLRDVDMFFEVAGAAESDAPEALREWAQARGVSWSRASGLARARARRDALVDALEVNGIRDRVVVKPEAIEVRGEVCDYVIDPLTGAVTLAQGGPAIDLSQLKRRDDEPLWAPHDDDQLLHTVLLRARALTRDDELMRTGVLGRARRTS
jgi:hypothetical protein